MFISIMLILSILIAMVVSGFVAHKIGSSLGAGNIFVCLPVFFLVQWFCAWLFGTYSSFSVVRNALDVFGF